MSLLALAARRSVQTATGSASRAVQRRNMSGAFGVHKNKHIEVRQSTASLSVLPATVDRSCPRLSVYRFLSLFI